MTTDLGEYSVCLTDKPLGKGSYATVYKGVHKATRKDVAIKVIEYDMRADNDKKYLDQELFIHASMKHPNVLELKHKQKIGTKYFVVLEFCAGGDLRSFLDMQPEKRLAEDVAKHFMCQMASSLQYLHDLGIVHRDIKPQNILLTEHSFSAQVKIADFGFARKIDPADDMQSVLGSPLYMAPEVIHHKPYKMKADLWSVGLVFFEMLSGKFPYTPRNMNELKAIVADPQPVSFANLPSDVSPECRDLLKGLLQKQPNQRFNWDNFFGHSYLQVENLVQSLVASRSFFLKVVSFYPHGQLTTVYIPPTETFGQLKHKITPNIGFAPDNQALFDKNGILLEDNVTIETVGFHKSKEEIVIFLVPWALMDAREEFKVPQYVFPSTMPFPEVTVQINNKYHLIREKHASSPKITDAIRAAKADVFLCKQHFDYQIKVAAAVRMYLTRIKAQLSGTFQPVLELYTECFKSAAPLIARFDSILKELSTTKVALKKGEPAQSVLEILGEAAIRKDFKDLEVLFKELPTQKEHIQAIVSQAGEKADSAVSSALQKKIPDALNKCCDDISKIVETGKKRLQELETQFRQLQPKAMSPDFEKKEYAAIDFYLKVFGMLKADFDKAMEISATCITAKTQGARELIQHLQLVGPCNLDIKYANNKVETFQSALNTMLGLLARIEKHSKAAQSFKEAVSEVHRRKQFRQRLLSFSQKSNTHLDELYKAEIAQRQAFQRLWGRSLLPHVCPYLIRSEENEANIPRIIVGVPPFDMDLPEPPPSDTAVEDGMEDDFEFYVGYVKFINKGQRSRKSKEEDDEEEREREEG